MSQQRTGVGPTQTFSHEVGLYAGVPEFLTLTTGFVRDGVTAGESVLVATDAVKIEALRDTLGPDAAKVQFADMAEMGRNPWRIIPVWRDFVTANEGRPIRGIGEPIWAGRTAAELAECQRHEALLNVAFADSEPGWRLLCPYDTTALPEDVIDQALLSHPMVLDGTDLTKSPGYMADQQGDAYLDRALGPAPLAEVTMAFSAEILHLVREVVAGYADDAGLPDDRVADLVLVASELASNSVCHGGGQGELRLWSTDREVVCEVEDHGTMTKPLAGRVRPTPTQVGGRGLWLVQQLSDFVELSSATGRTRVRTHFLLPTAHETAD